MYSTITIFSIYGNYILLYFICDLYIIDNYFLRLKKKFIYNKNF